MNRRLKLNVADGVVCNTELMALRSAVFRVTAERDAVIGELEQHQRVTADLRCVYCFVVSWLCLPVAMSVY